MLFSSGWVTENVVFLWVRRSWTMWPMVTEEFLYSLKFQVLTDVTVVHLYD